MQEEKEADKRAGEMCIWAFFWDERGEGGAAGFWGAWPSGGAGVRQAISLLSDCPFWSEALAHRWELGNILSLKTGTHVPGTPGEGARD